MKTLKNLEEKIDQIKQGVILVTESDEYDTLKIACKPSTLPYLCEVYGPGYSIIFGVFDSRKSAIAFALKEWHGYDYQVRQINLLNKE
jgi:hypothetical protein